MIMEEFKKKKLPLLIAGAGGGGGSSGSRTPKEARDTVNSRAMSAILDLLGEGVLGGLVDGAKSIFLDGTPLQNSDGSYNHTGVTWWFRDGSPDQSIIDGFDFVETPRAVNLQVKTVSPVTFSVDNDEADRVRVIMKFPSLRTVDKKTGDTSGISVQFRFQISNGDNSFQDVIAEGESNSLITVTEKKTSNYYRSYTLNLPKPGSKYKVRVVRVTADHTNDAYLFDDTYIDSVGEIVDTALNYPNSALVGLKVNSEQFGSTIPARSYLIKGMKIRVPSNYSETDNEYVGTWDGTFQLLSSDNPAWILFDLLTNARYGLGEFVSESMIDLSQIYQIGRYCDEEVDDGFGGKEKRFAINTQITSRQDAYRTIQDIAGAFRGMIFWAGGMVQMFQDAPSDPVMLFSNSNVKDGKFIYKGTSRKDRPSVALITYNNKDDGYKQNVEYVEDSEAIKRYGIRKTESVAFGCTSRGQAHRVGLWTLYTARMESDIISFTAGMDASFLMPGETILIQNKYRAGRRNSGRIVAFTKTSITLDAPVDLVKAGFINFSSKEGKIVERDILESGSTSKITFKTPLTSAEEPASDAVWMISQIDLVPMQARVVKVGQADDGVSYEISAIQNNPSKYEAIDNGATLLKQNTTVLDPTFSKPENLLITEGTYLSSPGNLSVMLTASWEGRSPEYSVSWRRSDAAGLSNWQSQRVTDEQFELKNVAENGQYDFQVFGISVGGRKTEVLSATYQVLGTMTPPDAPTGLTATGDYRSILLNWINPGSIDLDHIEVLGAKDNDFSKAMLLSKVSSTNFTHNGLEDSVTWYYWIRAVNKRGMQSPVNSPLGTSATTKDVLSFLKNKITESELGQDLLSDIDSKATSEAVDNAINEVKQDVENKVEEAKQESQNLVSDAKSELNSAISKEITDRTTAITKEATDRAAALSKEASDRAAAISTAVADEAAARASAISKETTERTAALQKEVTDRAAAISTAVAAEATNRTNAISKEASDRAAAISSSIALEVQNRDKAIAATAKTLSDSITKEITDRSKAVADLDTKTANAITKEVGDRVTAVSNEAKARADAILNEQNDRKAAITNVSTQLQSATDSLAQQIAQVAAGTGEQFDSKAIWYFDTSNEGWTEDDNAATPMVITDDGWLKASNSTSSARSPNNMTIDAAAYRFIKLRLKKIGNPVWKGKLWWIGAGETGWIDGRTLVIDEPEYDVNGVATLTLHDIPWNASVTIRRFRFDLAVGQNADNYFLIDWIAVGRPTPGAGMAALQDEQTARVNADAAEANNRQTLAAQIRGSYEGNDLTKVSSGLIFQEQQARVTADKSEATARQSLETKVNDSVSSINQSLDTLNTAQQAQASDITGIQSALGTKADSSALQSLSTKVTDQGNKLASQGTSITQLQNSLNDTNTAVGKKADQTALVALQGTVTQQGKDITAANSSITNLQTSLNTTNSNVSKKADASAVNDLTSRVTSAEGKLSSQSDSITSLNNSLNNALADADASGKIPGNLIVNPSFERGTDGYSGISAKSTVVEVQIPHSGTRALKVDTGSVVPGQNIDFVKDRTYEVGVWVKQVAGTTDNGAGNNKLRIGNSAGNPVLEIPYTGAGTDWTKYSKVWKATETGSLPVTLNNNLLSGSRYFDDFYVIDITDRTNIDANASALSSLSNTVTQQGKDLVSQSTSINNLQNSLQTTNDNVAKKADSSAVSSLQSTVTQQGKDLSTASSNITNLQNSLTATNQNVSKKADQSALTSLTGRVDNTESGIAAANSNITGLTAAVRAGNASSGDIVSNPTFEPAYDRMGFAVVSSSSDGVPAGCPFANVAKLTGRDHHPNFNAIVATLGDVFEITALVACGAGNADFNLYIGTAANPSGSIGSPLSSGGNTKTTAIWTRVTWRFTVSQAMVDRGYIRPFLQISQNSPFGTVWYVTDWHMRNVTAAAKAQTTADATASALDTLSNTVTQQGKDISSVTNKATALENSINTTNDNVAKKADSSTVQALQSTVSQHGDTLSSQGQSIAQLQNGLTLGNLIFNGDLSVSSDGWNNSGSGSSYSYNASEKALQTGTNSIRVANMTAIPVEPGITLTVSFEIRSTAEVSSISSDTMGLVASPDFNPATWLASQTSWMSGISTTFQNKTFSFTIPANYTGKFVYVRFASAGGAPSGFSVLLRNVVVTSSVGIAGKADASALQALQSNVTQQGNTLTSQGNSITQLKNDLVMTNANVSKKAESSALSSLQSKVDQQGKTLESQSNSLTNLENNFSSLAVGGTNLIRNADTLEGWSSRHATETYLGDRVAYTRLAKGASGYTQLDEQTLDVTGRTEFVFSFYAKGAYDGQEMASYFYNPSNTTTTETSQGGKGGAGDGKAVTKLTTAWARYWVKWVIPATSGTKRLIAARLESATSADKEVWLCRPQLETGTVMTDWSPSPDDAASGITANTSAINSLTSRVTNAEGQLTAQSQSITNLQNSLQTTNSNVSKKADSSALQSLQNTVTQQGNDLTSVGGRTTILENNLKTTDANVAKKADATALSSLQNTVTQQGKDISSASDSITMLNNSVSAMSNMGDNLVRDSDFNGNGSAFVAQQNSGSTGSIVVFGAYGENSSGVRMLKVNATSPGLFANGKKPIPVNGSRKFRYIVRAKGISGAMNMLLRRWNFNGSTEGNYEDKNVTLTTDWQTITWDTSFSPNSGVDGQSFGIYCHPSNAEIWIDSFQVFDITDAVNNDVNASAISAIQSKVSQQGDDISSNTSSINTLSNQVVNGKQNMWSRRLYNLQLASAATEPTFSDIQGVSPILVDEVSDAPKLDFTSLGNYKVAYYKAIVRVAADTTITMAPGARVFDDTGAVYVNGVRVAFGDASWSTVSFDLKAGWNTVEFLTNQWTGQAYVNLGFKLSDKVDEFYSGLGVNALSNAITSVTSNVSKIGDTVSSNSEAITNLRNSLASTDSNVAKKADSSALQTLQNTVTNQGNTLSTQGSAITKLQGDLSTTNSNVSKKADSTALQSLQNTVAQQGNTLTSQGDSVTQLTNSVIAIQNENDASKSVPGNMLVNNSFERGFDGWANTGWTTLAAQNPKSGRYIIQATKSTGDGNACDQSVNMSAGRTYRVGAWVRKSADFTASNPSNTKISIRNNGGPIKDILLAGSDVGTSWVKVSVDYVPASDSVLTISLRSSLSAGYLYVDDVFCLDVTNEVTGSANSAAISSLTNRVTSAEGSLSSQGQSITQLRNDLNTTNSNVNKKADSSAVSNLESKVTQNAADIASNSTQTTMLRNSLASGSLIVNGGMSADASMWGDSGPGSAFTYDATEKSLRTTTGSVRVANLTRIPVEAGATLTISFEFKTSEAISGVSSDSVGFISDLNNPTGWLVSAAPWMNDVTTNWQTKAISLTIPANFGGNFVYLRFAAGSWIPATSARLYIRNVDVYSSTGVANKADASALSDLSSKVTQQGNTLSSQGSSITQLQNGLNTTNSNVNKKADQTALTALQGTVTQQGNDISSANSQITSLNASITAAKAAGDDLIPNPTFDPAYHQMGFNVVDTSSEGVPAGCPFKYAAKLASRDHIAQMNNIVATEGDVIEFSALVACGVGTAAFNLYVASSVSPAGGVSAANSGGSVSAAAGATWVRTTWRWTVTAAVAAKGYFRPFLQISQSSPFGTIWYATDWHCRNITAAAQAQSTADATATAINTLTNTVTQQGNTLTSVGNRTTSLENGLKSANDNIAKKADASALSTLDNKVTQQGNKVDSQGSDITQLKNSVSDISGDLDTATITPGNLITNPSFERGLSGYTGTGLSLFTTINAQTPNTGNKILSCPVGTGSIAQTVNVTKDRTYKLGVFARCGGGTAVENAGNNKLRIGNSSLLKEIPLNPADMPINSTWKEFSGTWKATVDGKVDVSIMSSLKTGIQYFDDFYFVDVTDVVNIEANGSAISSLTNRVTAAEGNISSQSSSITQLTNNLNTTNSNVSKKADSTTVQALQNKVDQQGSTLTSQGSNLTQLTNTLTTTQGDVAALQKAASAETAVPGNMLSNSSFERGLADWTTLSGNYAVVDAAAPRSGAKILRTTTGDTAVGQLVDMKAGRTYRVGVFARCKAGTVISNQSNNKLRIGRTDGSIVTDMQFKASDMDTGSIWTEFSRTYTPSIDARFEVSVRTSASAGEQYFDDMYLVDVTDENNISANSDAISGLQSRVTTAEGTIASQSSSITQLKNDLSTTNSNVSKKADAAALTTLTNRVTAAENNISTQSSAITNLQNGLTTANNNISKKADSSALTSLQNTVNQQGDSLTAQGSSITNIKSNINTLRNQISNPWFDGSLESYADGEQISGSGATVVTDQKFNGSKSLRLRRNANDGGNSDKTIGPWSSIRENAVYSIELWAMMPADQNPSSGWSTIIGIQGRNSAGQNSWQGGVTITESALGERGKWVKFSGKARMNGTGKTQGVVWMSTRGATGSGTPGYDLYIDDVVITDTTDAQSAQDAADANATATQGLTTRVTDAEGKIAAQASQLTSLGSKVDSASSKVDQMFQTLSDSQSTQASINTSLQSQVDAQASANIKNQTTLNDATSSIVSIKNTQQTQATQISAIATQQTTLSSQVGDQSAALQVLQETVANNDSLSSTWMVKMETNSGGKKYAAGIALGVDGKSLQSQFLIQADRLALINTANGNITTPFVIDSGVTYMNSAVIKDGSITNLKVGDLQSNDFVAGSKGWRITKGGGSEFNNVVVRGEIQANTGTLNNVTIKESCTVLGTVYANRIEGDVMIGEAGTVGNVQYGVGGSGVGSGDYDLFYINGDNYDRFIDTNLIVQMTSTFRSYGDIVVQTPGQADYVHFSWDAGNDGGTRAISLKGLLIRAAGKGQRNRVFVRATNGRGLGIQTYTPRVPNVDGNDTYNGVQREKFVITAFRTGARIASN